MNYRNLLKFLIVLPIVPILISACTSNSNNRLSLSAPSATDRPGLAQQRALLSAANHYMQTRNAKLAANTLAKMDSDTTLPSALANQKTLLTANIAIFNHRYARAIALLQPMQNNQTQMVPAHQLTLHKLLGYAYLRQGQIIPSAQQRIAALALEKKARDRQQTINALWQSLEILPKNALQQQITTTESADLRGWLTLALVTKDNPRNVEKLSQELQHWRKSYPQHAANVLLPKQLTLSAQLTSMPKKVALLLPLTGQYASFATALRNGFFAAYYYAKHKQQPIPQLEIYNTVGKPIAETYKTALAQGAQFVIGPLTKSRLTGLLKTTKLTVPTLALNSMIDTYHYNQRNLYQFGLSPQDEARQVALRAYANHLQRALIIVPQNSWGQRIAQTYEQQWKALGGQVVGKVFFTDQKQLSKDIAALLKITASKERAAALRRILHQKFRFIPRRRKDADVILLAARPYFARQIKPLLRFYFAGHLPVYATSAVFSGAINPHLDHDLDGVVFCGMPWLLQPENLFPKSLDAIQQQIKQVWTKSYRQYQRLYALGVDAFDLIPLLNKMSLLPAIGTPAATGTLYLTQQQRVYRNLAWARMVDGKPHLIR